jgi:hypothetical protein
MNVVIFIDGIGESTSRAAGLDGLFDDVRSLRTGIGYTVNIITEVFAGLLPDDAGFFNKWGIAPEVAPLSGRPWARTLLTPLEAIPMADLAVRRVLRRLGKDTARIPWRMCGTFGKIGSDVAFGPNTPRSVFALPGVALAHPRGLSGIDHDAEVADMAEASILQGRDTIVFFTYLDGIGHDSGPDSELYLERAVWYKQRIAQLIHAARTTDSDPRVILVSDHSMLPVTFHVKPPRFNRNVIGFVDATMVRLWASDETADAASLNAVSLMASELAASGDGVLLTDADRQRFGVARRDWGDAIFVLNPGGLYVPDYFTGIHRSATTTALGMHGYYPDLHETRGIYLTLGIDKLQGSDPVTPLEAYMNIRALLAERLGPCEI